MLTAPRPSSIVRKEDHGSGACGLLTSSVDIGTSRASRPALYHPIAARWVRRSCRFVCLLVIFFWAVICGSSFSYTPELQGAGWFGGVWLGEWSSLSAEARSKSSWAGFYISACVDSKFSSGPGWWCLAGQQRRQREAFGNDPGTMAQDGGQAGQWSKSTKL